MTRRRDRSTLALALIAILLGAARGEAQGYSSVDLVTRPHVTIQLVPEATGVVPGQPVEVALRFTIEPGWHVYWENPGASGLATTVRWELPNGFRAGPLRFPVPELDDVSGIRTHVHHGDVAFLTTITPPAATRLSPARVVAEVHYGICRDACLAGTGRVAIDLPWVARPVANPAWAPVLRLAEARAPLPDGGPAISAVIKESVAVLRVQGDDLSERVTFFPSDRAVAPAATSVPPRSGRRGVILTLPLTATPAGLLRGVLVVGATGYEVSLPLKQ